MAQEMHQTVFLAASILSGAPLPSSYLFWEEVSHAMGPWATGEERFSKIRYGTDEDRHALAARSEGTVRRLCRREEALPDRGLTPDGGRDGM
jgi:hypothetical protein